MKNLIKEIKENNQDFEFYPTTTAMAQAVFKSLPRNPSFLDIGCGSGNIFNKFESFYTKGEDGRINREIIKKFGIEKSEILIKQCAKDIVIIGTDFNNSTLIDKEVDVVFCNPPYSQFEDWAAKIIKEAFCKQIYLIIPRRWKDSKEIKEALEFRDLKADVIYSGDFLDAERQARASVDIIKINCEKPDKYNRTQKQDPFCLWFKETFKIQAEEAIDKYRKEEESKEKINNALVAGDDVIKTLCNLYRLELAKLYKNYQSLGELDQEIFIELNISVENLIEACKLKISGLKKLYWQELFSKLDKIRSRLIAKYRKEILDEMNSQIAIDFEESNIYAVLIWVIKNTNNYFEKQIVEVFKDFSTQENIKNYKSNLRTWEQERWRFNSQNPSHYTLELRVIKFLGSFSDSYRDWQVKENVNCKLNDVFVVADSLGFKVINKPIVDMIGSYEFKAIYQEKEINFLDFKIFKNGNGHFKFNQEFMKKFNVEASRILGWIRSPKEAAQEFQGDSKVSEEEAQAFYTSTFKIDSNNTTLLLN
jgi:SAM-dependent methyltransferase